MALEHAASIDYLRLALAFKALGGGPWEHSIDTGVLNCSQRWYEILGIEESTNPIGAIEEVRRHIHPDDAARAMAVFHGASHRLREDDVYHIDFRISRESGAIRWIRSLVCLIKDADSKHRKVVGCVTDITDFLLIEAPAVIGRETTRAYEPSAHDKVTAALSNKTAHLTDKEQECLSWVNLGKTASETGIILGKSRRTIEFHLNNAVRKLRAANKVHAAVLAVKAGLI